MSVTNNESEKLPRIHRHERRWRFYGQGTCRLCELHGEINQEGLHRDCNDRVMLWHNGGMLFGAARPGWKGDAWTRARVGM